MKAYLDPEDITLLEQAADNPRDRLLVRVLFHLGCRVSEALGIKIEDIDFDAGEVTIQHLKVRLNLACPHCGKRLGKSHVFCPGCGANVIAAVTTAKERKRLRTIPIDTDTLSMFRTFITNSARNNEDDLIFKINRHRAWQIIHAMAGKANLPRLINPDTGKMHGVSPHRLRDAFAVHAVKADDSGDGLRLLQQHLGHASFNTTARYRKVSGEEQKEWYQRIWKKQTRNDQ